MLNRNPFDEDRAAREQAGTQAGRDAHQESRERARDERGLRLLHAVRRPRGLTAEQVRRIASRLDAAVVPARRRSLVPILAALALLLSAGTALAWATGTLPLIPVVGTLFQPTGARRSPSPAPRTASAPVRPLEVAAPKEQSPAAETEELDRAGVSRPRRAEPRPPSGPPASRRHASAPSATLAARPEAAAPKESSTAPTPAPLPPDSPIAREGESFAKVLRMWRRDHDGRAAQSALDVHDRLFAGGQMALESRLLRVEVLLSQGRDSDALVLLDRLALGKGNVPRGRELLTVRGELRIKAGRCQDGRADLASIGPGSDGLAERARNALTYCR